MNKNELLAPVGNIDMLKASVLAGADAIYIGGFKYSARKSASFNDEDLLFAIKYAHKYNVKVYIAVNIIIYENEFKDVIDYIDFLYINGVDGLIIQDFGLLNYCLNRYENFQIHASTQMGICNVNGVLFLEKLAVNRIVLAREIQLSVLLDIRKKSNIELELFISGAHCVSFSGYCYFSSFIGSRSGNRGDCAQICRKKFKLLDKELNTIISVVDKDYLLSLKDLFLGENIKVLENIKNVSYKIEGRLKSYEYIYSTVKYYSNLIENKIIDSDYNENTIKSLFNRDLTQGYLMNNKDIANPYRSNNIGVYLGKVIKYKDSKAYILLSEDIHQHDGIRFISNIDEGMIINYLYNEDYDLLVNSVLKGNICIIKTKFNVDVGSKVYKTTDVLLKKRINNDIGSNYKTINLNISFYGSVNNCLIANIFKGKEYLYSVDSDFKIEESQKHLFSTDIFIKQFTRTKNEGILFLVDSIEIDSNCFINASSVNAFRKDILLSYETFTDSKRKQEFKIEKIFNKISSFEKEIIVSVYTIEQLLTVLEIGIKIIYLRNLSIKDEALSIYPNLYLTTYKNDSKTFKDNNILVNNYGDLLIDTKHSKHTNFTLNTTNSYSIKELIQNNISLITLSYEVSVNDALNIVDSFNSKYGYYPNVSYIIYGYSEVMSMKHCPVSVSNNELCNNCMICDLSKYRLVDDYNKEYMIINDNYYRTILFHRRRNNIDEIYKLKDKINIRLDFYNESKEEIVTVLSNVIEKY